MALGAGVGVGVALAGAALQGLLRNPLADPGLIGVTGGAALGAAVVLVLGDLLLAGIAPWLRPWLLPLVAFAGAGAVTAFVFLVARVEGGLSVATLILAGVVVNAIAGAGIGALVYVSDDDELRDLTFWSMGALGAAGWPLVLVARAAALLAGALLARLDRALDLFQLGERAAFHAGIEVERVKRRAGLLAALGVGAATAAAGPIGFVGLVAPHLARLLLGPAHAWVLPGSAALVLLADLAVRLAVPPAEPPIGLATSLIGGPFFLWLLLARARGSARGGAGLLEARAVTLAFGRAAPAVAGASLAIAPGEVVALCGPNGAGKSTLLAALAGEVRPRGGAVLLDGEPVGALGAAGLARRRAVLEQNPQLAAPFTARELAGLAVPREVAPGAAQALVAEALAEVGLAGLKARPVHRLSGGERQRAHLARALAPLRAGRALGQGRYLLLDEPTAGLDLAFAVAAMGAARRAAAEGAGVVAVLHDLDLAAAFADRVSLMGEGRLLVCDRPARALTEARLAALYGAPLRVEVDPDGGVRVQPVYPPPGRRRRPRDPNRQGCARPRAEVAGGGAPPRPRGSSRRRGECPLGAAVPGAAATAAGAPKQAPRRRPI